LEYLIFLREIILKTKDYASVFKPNFAYFESLGFSGMEVLRELMDYTSWDSCDWGRKEV
tara:strand:+ start:1822 stop:1998 length:177 start_codon:yes stop_codon:yes gene_type:complete